MKAHGNAYKNEWERCLVEKTWFGKYLMVDGLIHGYMAGGAPDGLTQWADSLLQEPCPPEKARGLFAAMAATGEAKYRAAIEATMAALGRDPVDEIDSAEDMLTLLPFRMAYEMQLGGMEKVGLVTAWFREAYRKLRERKSGLVGGSVQGTAYALLALVEAIDACSEQLYEHWRALVDMYRETLKAALAAADEADDSSAMIVYAVLEGVRMNLIDPERYLPVAGKRISALHQAGHGAADLLAKKGEML